MCIYIGYGMKTFRISYKRRCNFNFVKLTFQNVISDKII